MKISFNQIRWRLRNLTTIGRIATPFLHVAHRESFGRDDSTHDFLTDLDTQFLQLDPYATISIAESRMLDDFGYHLCQFCIF